MNVKVTLEGKWKDVKIPEKSSIGNLLEKLCINPETIVVLRNGEVTPEFEKLSKRDKIEIIDIVSRG